TCLDILNVLNNLIPNSPDSKSQVFFRTMRGDYFGYLAEFSTGTDREEAVKSAEDSYTRAADAGLPFTDPIRLGLALNHSVFLYEILKAPGEACKVAQHALQNAFEELDLLEKVNEPNEPNEPNEEVDKDLTLIMQRIRDNISLWAEEAYADA
ncbi:hypothetical protein BGZ94_005462, partial [Podila epigama]